MKVAKVKLFGNEMITGWEDYMEDDQDWIRLSEVVEVDFIDLPPEVTIPPQVAFIEAKITEARERFGEVMSKLEGEKAKLLAITHQ